jgi:uncharacterized protein
MHIECDMTDDFQKKVSDLKRRFQEIGSAVVAFSGGVDSAVLVAVAREELGGRMIAATSVSPSMPTSDIGLVEKFCKERCIPHRFVETKEFENPVFLANPDDRCYFCKRHLYGTMAELADELGFRFVVEGTNSSDLSGHRPGYRASRENPRVITPLIECGFTKDDVRRLANELALPNADKPSSACLSSRVPTGSALSGDLLMRIDRAEDLLRSMGATQVRLRHHGDVARIEVLPGEMKLCLDRRQEIYEGLKKLGWKFVSLDMQGYRTGGGNA